MQRQRGWRVSAFSLSGGQGKTTLSLLLGIYLIRMSYRILWIDIDPQGTLSDYLQEGEGNLEESLATALEKGDIKRAIVPTRFSNGFLIPSNERLAQTNYYLANSGMSTIILDRKLRELDELQFDFILLDPPPNQNHLNLAVIGATNLCLIPVETTAKGSSGLFQTLSYLEEYRTLGAFRGEVIGIIPFRERWFGQSMAKDSQSAKKNIAHLAELHQLKLMHSIIESEAYKKAIANLDLPSRFGHPELDYPLRETIQAIFAILSQNGVTLQKIAYMS